MPSRILKESICTSESLAYLSAEAEVLFYRLIVKADDFGLYYGSPKILASLLFPLNVPTEKKVSSWLAELVNGGLVATYRAEDGRQYLKLLSWDKHQNRRATKPKYPLPQEFDNTCSQEVSSDNSDTCAQMQADSSVNVNENVFENVNEKRKRVSAQRGAGVDDAFNPDLTNQIVQGVERWKRSEQWTKDDGRFIPYPATFLRGERWNEYDRAEVIPSPKPAPVKNYDDGEDFLDGGE